MYIDSEMNVIDPGEWEYLKVSGTNLKTPVEKSTGVFYAHFQGYIDLTKETTSFSRRVRVLHLLSISRMQQSLEYVRYRMSWP